MLKIALKEDITIIPSGKIGIDMGQSLSKLVYLEDAELVLSLFPTKKSIAAIKDLLNSKMGQFNTLNFTGGKSYNLYREYCDGFPANLINEFEANVKGLEFLFSLEKKKELPRSLVVTIGTGTSIVLKNDKIQHLGGSALGGGFFMGLIKTLFDLNNFQEAMNLSKKGNRYNIDLKVSDIYSPEDNRVDLLFREFTAASLGKIDEEFQVNLLKREDFISSIICLIGENLGSIATITADKNNVKDIVFSGGFLKENKILKKILSLTCKINQKKAIFLKNSEFCAAIGALII
jgi:type II pantothenate kinase